MNILSARQKVTTPLSFENEDRIMIPGSPDNDRGVTLAQLTQIQNFLTIHGDERLFGDLKDLHWGKALDILRRDLRMRRNDWSFRIIDRLNNRIYDSVADNPLTSAQSDYLGDILGALNNTGTASERVQRAMNRVSPQVREILRIQALQATTSGQFSQLLTKYQSFLPRVSDVMDELDQESGVPSGDSGGSLYGDEEPF